MIRFILRFFGLLSLAAALAALVVDGTRAIATDTWSFSSLQATFGALSPNFAPNAVARLPAAWRAAAEAILRGSPTCVVLAALGLILFALTARSRATREGRPGWTS